MDSNRTHETDSEYASLHRTAGDSRTLSHRGSDHRMIDNHFGLHSDEPAARPVRILIESSEYWLRNNGDLAMLEVTITRLRRRWPDAQIGVLTDVPLLLRAYHPTAKGITVLSTDPWA